jgi:hypothetical protein
MKKSRSRLNEVRVDKYKYWDKEIDMSNFNNVESIVKQVKFPGYNFKVTEITEEICSIHVYYDEPDVFSGVNETQHGRDWLVSYGATEGAIVATCLKAVLTSFEHRTREHFTYKNVPIFYPHFEIEDLLQINKDKIAH